MKNIFFIILLLCYIQVQANMAEPVDRGTLGSTPFTSQHVDIVHEDLRIKIDKYFNFASFMIKYHIKSDKDGLQVPLLFYASDYLDEFEVFLDGNRLEVNKTPYGINADEDVRFEDFSYFFEDTGYSDYDHVLIEESSEGDGFFVRLDDMVYFEVDLSEGEHLIEVSYRATRWKDGWDWVNKYSFRYALSPANYWRSFGTFDLQIDATAYPKPLTINIQQPNEGDINTISTWHFDEIPVRILQISYIPEVSQTANTLVAIGPDGLAIVLGLLLILLHLWLTFLYRKKHPEKRYSKVVIIGSLIIPLVFLISRVLFDELIVNSIGEEAGRQYGYMFLMIFLYPFIMPVYWGVFALIDYFIKKRFRN